MEVMISKTVITLALFIATLVLLTSPASATTVSYEPNSVSISILVWNQSGQSLNDGVSRWDWGSISKGRGILDGIFV